MVINVVSLKNSEHVKKEEDDSRGVVLLVVHGEAAAAPRGDGDSEVNPMLQLLPGDVTRL